MCDPHWLLRHRFAELAARRYLRKWTRWVDRQVRIHEATEYWKKHAERTLFARWRRRTQHSKRVRAAFESAISMWNNRIASKAMNSWKMYVWMCITERMAVTLRKHQLLRRHWVVWRRFVVARDVERQMLAEADAHYVASAARRLLQRWADATALRIHEHEKKQAAMHLFRNHYEGHAFLVWKRYLRQRRRKHRNTSIAVDHWRQTAGRAALRRWRVWVDDHHTTMRRIGRAVAYAALQLEQQVFLRWHDTTVANRAARMAVKQGAAHFRRRACHRALAMWRAFATRHATSRARMRVVLRFWRGHTLRDHFERWVADHRERRRQQAVQAAAVVYWRGHCMHTAFLQWRKYHDNRRYLKKQFAARTIQVSHSLPRPCCSTSWCLPTHRACHCVMPAARLASRRSGQRRRGCPACEQHAHARRAPCVGGLRHDRVDSKAPG